MQSTPRSRIGAPAGEFKRNLDHTPNRVCGTAPKLGAGVKFAKTGKKSVLAHQSSLSKARSWANIYNKFMARMELGRVRLVIRVAASRDNPPKERKQKSGPDAGRENA
jgi:hypothetical protein